MVEQAAALAFYNEEQRRRDARDLERIRHGILEENRARSNWRDWLYSWLG